jgi:predicted DNA-binding protein
MLSVRLPEELEQEVNRIASAEQRTKTQIIREALTQYVESHRNQRSPYELGTDLFGNHGSGDAEHSSDYKGKLKEKLRAKHAY